MIILAIVAGLLVSVVEVVAAPGLVSADPPKATAVDPRNLPLLPGSPPAPEPVAPANPNADFTPLAGSGASHFDPHRSRPVSRSMFATEFENPDGTRSVRQSTEPLNVKDSTGTWHPVDTGLTADSGRVRAKRHPLNPSLGQRGDAAELISVEVDGKRAALSMDQASPSSVRTNGSKVGYADIRPGTDVDYEITAGSVKETIRLKQPPAPGQASWRFRLSTTGLTPQLAKDGSVLLVDDTGRPIVAMPPIETWDSSGTEDRPPAMTGGRYHLEPIKGGWVLTVSVDEAWLRDPKRIYPVSVDPTFTFADDTSFAYKSDGFECQNCGVKMGNPLDNGSVWRSVFHFDYSSLWGKAVVGARLDVSNTRTPVGVDKTYNADLYHATAFNFNGVGEHLGSALVGQVGSFSDARFTQYLRTMVDNRDVRPYFMLVGAEIANVWTYKSLVVSLTVDTGTAPPAAGLVGPADNSVVTSLTPTLSVTQVSDPDADPVKYCFKVATGPDAKTGVVVDSGCLSSPTWTVPVGVLQDGTAYTWQATTFSGITSTPPSWVGHFRVDQRIGDKGPAPVDTVGPVTVNLANGNLTTSVSSPTFTTVGGTAGVSFTYNSQQKDSKGLRASYFADLSHTGNISDSQQPVLVRTEPQVNVDFWDQSPFPPALETDWFVVRWEGFFQVPVTGTYQFAGVHNDSLKVWINNNLVYNVGCCSEVNWTQATGVSLSAGQRVPIKVEFAEAWGTAWARLFVRANDGSAVPEQIVPADWLHPTDLPALPQGWTLSADLDGTGATYTEARIADQTIVLTDATGAKHTWTKKSDGGYKPPEDEDGVLSLDTAGRVTLTEGADVYVFRTDGKLETQSSALDSRKPAALQNLYDGTPSRLREIKDPVSGRSHRLLYNRPGDDCYGGSTPPGGADALPPNQMLCRVVYWDGTETRLWYAQGRLFRIEDPGSEITDYHYNSAGPMDQVRDSLSSDWIAADWPARANTNSTTILHYYDAAVTKPIMREVWSPEPTPGQSQRPKHGYRYDPANRQTFVDVAGLTPATGFFTKVTYDDAFRLLSTTDATGRTTSQTWSVKDQQLSSTDAAGRKSTTLYDHADRPTDTFGPAPTTCFNGQVPTPACANTVPYTHTAYDESMPGLSASFYDNTGLAGAPKFLRTGFGDPSGLMTTGWSGTTSPAPGIPAGTFSIRLTGEIQFPTTGNYRMELWVDDGARMWIDDQLIMGNWAIGDPHAILGTYNNTVANSIHRIRVDYYNGGGAGTLHVKWQRPDGTHEGVPGSFLRPRYGLTTSTLTSESDGVPDQINSTRYNDNGLDPVFGLATATIAGSGGLQLTSRTGYETPGSGYLRHTTKTLPSGAATSYVYYGDTETRANPCVPGSPAVNQGGMAKLTTLPTPAVGPARVDEQIYDASGRVVAKVTSGDWTCMFYDARDRLIQTNIPAYGPAPVRVAVTNYAVNGDPLTTSLSDNRGTITTRVDLLGRVVSYTDTHGLRTDTVYDLAGRISSETVTPPNSADPPQATTFTYDDAGRVLTHKLDNTVLATATHDAAGELATVTYSNGSSLSAIGRDPAGRITTLTWKTSDNTQVTSTVTRTRSGTVVDETLAGIDARPNAPNYLYDAIGRLTEAWVTGHHYTYDFTSAAPAGCPTGTRANGGTNTNRVRQLDATASGTAETGYCYDDADRILATTGASTVSSISYDTHGNTLSYIHSATTTTLGWDGADRNLSARVTGADPADITYTRDATDRLVRRDASTGDTTATVLYAYTGSGDSADVALTGDRRFATRSISLPGGVLYTVRGGAIQPTWDHPTIRGDLGLTTDAAGRQPGPLRTYSPFGEPLTTSGVVDPDNVPDNQPGQMDHGWLGQHQRPHEHAGALSIVQMGARPYSPLLGRFLSVDPVDGGSLNDYEYVGADPINTTDLDGKCWICRKAKAAGRGVAKGFKRFGRGAVNGFKWVTGGVVKGFKWVTGGVVKGFTWVTGGIGRGVIRLATKVKTWWQGFGALRVRNCIQRGAQAARAVGGHTSIWGVMIAGILGCASAFLGR